MFCCLPAVICLDSPRSHWMHRKGSSRSLNPALLPYTPAPLHPPSSPTCLPFSEWPSGCTLQGSRSEAFQRKSVLVSEKNLHHFQLLGDTSGPPESPRLQESGCYYTTSFKCLKRKRKKGIFSTCVHWQCTVQMPVGGTQECAALCKRLCASLSACSPETTTPLHLQPLHSS